MLSKTPEPTVRLTTAQALVRFLNAQAIEVDGAVTSFVAGVFAVFGHGNVLGLGEALTAAPGHLRVYQGHNEQGMASTAIAYSRQLRRHQIFAVTASAGPGAANFVTAAGNAKANGIPVLFLPADTFASRQPDPVLQQVETEGDATVSTNDALKPLSVYWDRITRPEQLMSALLKAFTVLTDPRTAGPVTLALPQDAEAEAYDFPTSFFQQRVHHVKRTVADATELAAAVAAIKAAEKPVMIVGGGAKYSGAQKAIAAFATAHHVPILVTPSGKSTVPDTHPWSLGGVGVLGTGAANAALGQADLVLGLGTRYTDFTTASKTAFDPHHTQVINVNLQAAQAARFDGLAIVADVKTTVHSLDDLLKDYQSQFDLAPIKAAWAEERARLRHIDTLAPDFTPEVSGDFEAATLAQYRAALGTDLAQTPALMAVNETIADDAIMVAAAGSLPGDVHRLWVAEQADTYHMEYGYSMMGYEIAGALGVKLAQPDREVYALVGDGSFVLQHSELLTALQYDQKINIVLFDNAGFASINNLQMANGNPSFRTEFRQADHSVMRVNYAQIAAGYGAVTYEANTEAQLVAALTDAQHQRRSTLIDVKVLPKTMTQGYGQAWWHVGVPAVSTNPAVTAAHARISAGLQEAFKY